MGGFQQAQQQNMPQNNQISQNWGEQRRNNNSSPFSPERLGNTDEGLVNQQDGFSDQAEDEAAQAVGYDERAEVVSRGPNPAAFQGGARQ
jgi:hypothetical protein